MIATRFDSPFAPPPPARRRSGPSEPRDRDRDDRRDRDYGDPVGDWRSDGDRRSRRGHPRNAATGDRLAGADEIYGGDLRGRGQDRRPTHPSDTRGGFVLDVPEFTRGAGRTIADQ